MATSQVSEVIRHLRRTVLLRDAAVQTDGQLLEGFISRREEAALTVLVQRYGPMVCGTEYLQEFPWRACAEMV
jgi:hypothetical protein